MLSKEQKDMLSDKLSTVYQQYLSNQSEYIELRVNVELIDRGFLPQRLSWLKDRSKYLLLSDHEIQLIAAVFDKMKLTVDAYNEVVGKKVATERKDAFTISAQDISSGDSIIYNCKYIRQHHILGEISIGSLEQAIENGVIKTFVPLDETLSCNTLSVINIDEFNFIKIYYPTAKQIPNVINNTLTVANDGAFLDLNSAVNFLVLKNTFNSWINIPVVVSSPELRRTDNLRYFKNSALEKIILDLKSKGITDISKSVDLLKIFENLYTNYSYDKILDGVTECLSNGNEAMISTRRIVQNIKSKLGE